jgi:AcrR family transcriptional regulator
MIAKRAYDATAKEARRQVILDAADKLFAEDEQLPSVSRVADAAGLAKGTVYLYFRTKEEIFAFLLLEGWSRVIETATKALTAENSPTNAVAAFISAFARALDNESNLLRLDALGKGVLEENMTPEALLAFKSQFHGRLDEAGALFERTLQLVPGRGAQLLTRTHALTRGIWQSFGSGHARQTAEAVGPTAFRTELREALTEYWRGAMQPAPT